MRKSKQNNGILFRILMTLLITVLAFPNRVSPNSKNYWNKTIHLKIKTSNSFKPVVKSKSFKVNKSLNYSKYNRIIKDYSELIPIIKESEGLRLTPYICPGGYPTIGYGHVLNNRAEVDIYIKQNNYQIDTTLADYILLYDIDRNRQAVIDLIEYTANKSTTDTTILINLQNLINNKYKMLALTSFSYALGIGNLSKSTMWKLIINNKPIDNEIIKWCVLNGQKNTYLLKRRRQELKFYKLGE